MHAACARPLHAHAACANSMKRLLAIQMCHPPHPRHQKIRAEAKAAKTRAPWPWAPFSPLASAQLAGGTLRALLGCGAQAGAAASLQHHYGSGRGVFRGARVRSAPMHDRIHFLAPSSGRCSRRRSVSVLGTLPHCLRLPRPFLLSSLRARRCFPRSAPSPANAWLRTDCWLLPKPSSAKCAQRHRPGPLRALLYVCFGGQLAGSCSACRRSNGVRAL